jgi:hypothetical protein
MDTLLLLLMKSQGQVGRPRTVSGNRFSGREMRAPRRIGGPGRARILPDPPNKPFSEMTTYERRLYRAAQKREKRRVARVQKHTELELKGRPQPVYAPDTETAQRIAGPNAVAVKRVTVVVSVERWNRARRTARFLKACGMDINTSRLIEMNLDETLGQLEDAFNGGEPCPDVELSEQRRPLPIPTTKKRSSKK